jgi:hypothetical protein
VAWAAVPAGRSAPPPPGLPEIGDPLPIAPAVKDPLFAILLGILDHERQGVLHGERIDREVRRRGGTDRFLYNQIAWVTRQPNGAGAADVRVQFWSPVQLPFPYSILGYHPGKVRATVACRLREWDLGQQTLGARQGTFTDVRLFALEEGDVLVDVDGWLDALAGDALDDANLSGLALLRYGAQRYGIAYGRNREGEWRSGVLDFRRDQVMMPPPAELKGVVRDVVRRVDALRKAPQGPT